MPGDTPLVSVVIPTCNRREILERCLEALALQTYRVIVVDDASTDDTPDLLARFAAEHPQLDFRFLRNERRMSANPSRNRGIRESRGRFVAFLDNDSIAKPDWLERIIAGFVSDRVAAVNGLVIDPEPTNIYERTLKGTHRVHGAKHATRLVSCNLCVRRDLLLRFMLDEDRASVSPDVRVSGRGDEEGLFLMLRAAGYEMHVAHDAVVLHEHYHTRSTFFKQAYRGGASAARLGYKYHLPPRIELAPLLAAYLLGPLALIPPHGWLPSAFFGSVFMAAILYNELVRKRKTPWETIMILPVLLAYYHVRLAGYVVQQLRLWTGHERIERVDLRNSEFRIQNSK